MFALARTKNLYLEHGNWSLPQTANRSQVALDRTGNVLEPIVGVNYEADIEGVSFDKRLNAVAAIFRLEQSNLTASDDDFGRPNKVCPSWCHIAQGEDSQSAARSAGHFPSSVLCLPNWIAASRWGGGEAGRGVMERRRRGFAIIRR
jgi:hypothetical protein